MVDILCNAQWILLINSLNSSSVTDASTGDFTYELQVLLMMRDYGLNSGLGENTDDADSDRGGQSIGFENGGTVNTTYCTVKLFIVVCQSSASVDLDTISFHTLYGDLA